MYIDNNRHNAAITTVATAATTTEQATGKTTGEEARQQFRPLQTLNNIKTFSFTICSVGLWLGNLVEKKMQKPQQQKQQQAGNKKMLKSFLVNAKSCCYRRFR